MRRLGRFLGRALLALVVVFTPLMGLVLVPLLLRIRREAAESGRATATA